MDPNACLKELLSLAEQVREANLDPDECAISEARDAVQWANEFEVLVESLNGWLSSKGFLPERWNR